MSSSLICIQQAHHTNCTLISSLCCRILGKNRALELNARLLAPSANLSGGLSKTAIHIAITLSLSGSNSTDIVWLEIFIFTLSGLLCCLLPWCEHVGGYQWYSDVKALVVHYVRDLMSGNLITAEADGQPLLHGFWFWVCHDERARWAWNDGWKLIVKNRHDYTQKKISVGFTLKWFSLKNCYQISQIITKRWQAKQRIKHEIDVIRLKEHFLVYTAIFEK